MDLRTDHPYAAEPGAVFAMLTDPEFLRAKLAALGHRDIEVSECTPERIVTRRTVPLDVPGVLRKVISPANTVVQTDEWGPERDGVREGTWQVDARGIPVALSGTMRLHAGDGGSVETIEGRAKASVPLVGGKLEKFVVDNTLDTLAREHAFGREWLATH
jgi:hypothetical protein